VVFSSSHFLFYFLPIFLAVYFLTPAKNIVLLIFSLLFYAWGEGIFVLLLIFSSLFNYTMARAIDLTPAQRPRKLVPNCRHRRQSRRAWYFKYFAFTFSSLIAVLEPKDLLPPRRSFAHWHFIFHIPRDFLSGRCVSPRFSRGKKSRGRDGLYLDVPAARGRPHR
jgi:D-alanyl-lipoteichoic acid acyltransferase DltB (MBOAT superfamily)